MKAIGIAFLLALTCAGNANAQHITQLSPPNITFRGVSIADSTHTMVVGDSASIFTSTGSDTMRIWHSLPAPCDKSHTFNGVSYYDTNRAAIVTNAGLIFTTSDVGMHWEQSAAGMTGQTLRAITHTSNGSLIVVGDSGIILRSTDSGASWSKLDVGTTYNINAIAINNLGRGYFAGAHGLIGRTTNFGATWPLITDTITNLGVNREPITFRGIAINTTNFDGIAVGDSGGLAQTSNGTSWQAISPTIFGYGTPDSDYTIRVFDSLCYTSVLYVGIVGNPGIYWRLTANIDLYAWIGEPQMEYGAYYWEFPNFDGDADGGTDEGIERAQCQAIWRGSPNFFVQYGGPFEDVETSTGSLDPYWQGFVEPSLTIPQLNFLFVSIDTMGYGFASMTGGVLTKTTDGGLIWKVVQYYDNVAGTETDIHTIDSNNAFAIGWAGNEFRTTNGGQTWDSTNITAANQERLHSIAHPAESVYVVSGDFGTVIRSTDNAFSWNASIAPTTNYLEAVAFSTSDIGIAAGQNGTIIRTTDQGITWTNINNQLTGTDYSYRQLQAFPSGTYYATTDSEGLWRSTDQGLDWLSVSNAPKTMGMNFYNERIGVIAEDGWCSLPATTVNDTARFAFSRDGFATITEFTIPIVNNSRMAFHFLDSNTFLCFGSDGFVVKVDMSQGSASVTQLSAPQTSPIQVFPNPSATHSTTIAYDLDQSGATTIELWNALGEKVQTLFVGNEEAGHHSRQLTINPELHGTFFVKVISGTAEQTLPIVVE